MISVCLIKYDMTDKTGGERVTSILSQALAQTFCVHVVSINGRGEAPYFHLDSTVHYQALLEGHHQIRKTTFSGAKALHAYMKANRIDVCMAIGGNVNLFMFLATRGTKIRTVFCEHLNLVMANQDRMNALLRWLASRFADKIVTLTKRDREEYIKKYHLPENRVEYIYNWVDSKLLQQEQSCDTNAKKIITVGRYEPQKGLDYLVEAAEIVLQRHPDWQWDVYGDGPDFPQISRLVQQKYLEGRLNLMGAKSDIYSRYSAYSVYVMTSRFEGLPMVLLEAKSQGLPVVSFDCLTGPGEIVRHETDGLLVEPYHTRELAEQVCRLIEHPQLRQEFSRRAKENLSLFEKEEIVEKWNTLLKSLT